MLLSILLALVAWNAGCGGTEPGEADIRTAIESYLRDERGIDPGAMRIEVVDVRVDGETATAVARYSSTDAPAGLEFEYVLERTGDGWKVESSRPRSGHGGQPMPEDHPPVAGPDDPPSTAS